MVRRSRQCASRRSIASWALATRHALRSVHRSRRSRVSPASVFALASTNLSGTSLRLKERYLDSAAEYRQVYLRFLEEKTGSSSTGWWHGGGQESDEEIDPHDLPKFDFKDVSTADHVNGALPDLAILFLFNIVFFVGAFVAFLRYDVR